MNELLSALRQDFAAALRGVRRSMARDRLMANLRTLLTVIPLTILVWVYAEQQQLVTEPDVPLRIALASSDPAHRQVSLMSPSDGTIRVTLQGSQIGIDRVKAALEQTFLADPLTAQVGALPTGDQTLVAIDQIQSNRVFYSHGVTVTACAPETLQVRIDNLVDRAAPVRAPADAPGLVKATFDPPTVALRGPAQLLDSLSHSNRLAAIAMLDDDPALAQPGQHDKILVHLTAPSGVTVIPDTALANLTVGQADQTVAVTPVPVKVAASKWLMDNYKFDFKDTLTTPVTLVSPPLQMALIDPHRAPIVAEVDLDNTDASFHGQKPVIFRDAGLPDGVRVKADPTPTSVQINVDPR